MMASAPATLPARHTSAPCQNPNAYPAASSTGSAGMTAESCWTTTSPMQTTGASGPRRAACCCTRRPPVRYVSASRPYSARNSTIVAPISTSTPTTSMRCHGRTRPPLPACGLLPLPCEMPSCEPSPSGLRPPCEPLPRPCEPTRLPPGRLPLSPSFAMPSFRVSCPDSPTTGAAAGRQ